MTLGSKLKKKPAQGGLFCNFNFPLNEFAEVRCTGGELRQCATARRSRLRFPKVSLELIIDLILPAALWHWDRLSLKKKSEYQEQFHRGKGDRCLGLTTLFSSYAVCLEILGV